MGQTIPVLPALQLWRKAYVCKQSYVFAEWPFSSNPIPEPNLTRDGHPQKSDNAIVNYDNSLSDIDDKDTDIIINPYTHKLRIRIATTPRAPSSTPLNAESEMKSKKSLPRHHNPEIPNENSSSERPPNESLIERPNDLPRETQAYDLNIISWNIHGLNN